MKRKEILVMRETITKVGREEGHLLSLGGGIILIGMLLKSLPVISAGPWPLIYVLYDGIREYKKRIKENQKIPYHRGGNIPKWIFTIASILLLYGLIRMIR